MTANKMSLASAVLSAALVVISTESLGVSGHSCFVCTDDGPRQKAELRNLHKLFPGKKLFKCSEYDPSRTAEFVFKCPPKYNGCMTTWAGNSGIRSCSTTAVDSCESINGIMHCYCTADACNNPSSKLSDPVALKQTDKFNFRGSQYLDIEGNYDDKEGGVGELGSADYGDDDDDTDGSGDYPDDYSDMTEPPTSLEIDEDGLDGGGQRTKVGLGHDHHDTINDLEFDEEGDGKVASEATEDEKESDKVKVRTSGARAAAAGSLLVILPLLTARL